MERAFIMTLMSRYSIRAPHFFPSCEFHCFTEIILADYGRDGQLETGRRIVADNGKADPRQSLVNAMRFVTELSGDFTERDIAY
jgi:hypothetical protein